MNGRRQPIRTPLFHLQVLMALMVGSITICAGENRCRLHPLPRLAKGQLGQPRWTTEQQVYQEAITGDNQIVLAGSADGIYIWRAASGARIKKLSTPSAVRAVTVASSDNRYAVGMLNGDIWVGALPSGEVIHKFNWKKSGVATIAISWDEKWVAAGYEGGNIVIGSLETGEIRASVPRNNLPPTKLKIELAIENPRLQFLATGQLAFWSWGDAIYYINPESGALSRKIEIDSQARILGISRDGRRVAGARWNQNHWEIHRFENGREADTISIPVQVSNHLEYLLVTPDGQYLVSEFAVWKWSDGKEQSRLILNHAYAETLYGMNFVASQDGKYLVSGAKDNVGIWDLVTGEEVRSMPTHHAQVGAIAFSPDGQSAVTSAFDESILVWNLQDCHMTHLLPLKRYGSMTANVSWSANGQLIYTGGNDKTLRTWGASTGKEQHEEIVDVDWAVNLAKESRQPWLASWGMKAGRYTANNASDEITVWDSRNWKIQGKYSSKGSPMNVSFSPNGRMLAVDERVQVDIWNLTSGKKLHTLSPEGWSGPSRFTHDGAKLIVLNYPATTSVPNQTMHALVYSTSDWKRIGSFTMPQSLSSQSLEISPDDRWLAMITLDGSLAIIRLTDMVEIVKIKWPRGKFNVVAFSPDGKQLAAGCMDHTTYLWNVSDLIKQ